MVTLSSFLQPKKCPDCKQDKLENEFYRLKSGKLNGQCKDCSRKRARDWSKNNRPRALTTQRAWQNKNREKVRAHNLKSAYGLTPDDYEAMFRLQGGVCAICKQPSKKKLNIDHCHKTRKVRSLLCQACNQGLGNFRDNQNFLRAAAQYLSKHDDKQETLFPVKRVYGKKLDDNQAVLLPPSK